MTDLSLTRARVLLSACALAVTLLALAPGPRLRAGDEAPTSWEGRVDGIIKPIMEKKGSVGLVVGIVTPDGKRAFFCYGRTKADGPKPTPETLFEIGSVSKPVTSLLFVHLVEKGEIKLEDPVRLHLPKALVVPRRGEREITLLELATHTSGLPRNPPNQQRLVIEDATVAADPYGKYDAKQLAAGLAESKLKDEARPAFAYSNFGAGLLGEALAHKAGTSYGELARTRVFEPLKLKDTTVSPSATQKERMATGHNSKGKAVPPWTFASLHGCGAVCSTPHDLLAFHEAYCGRTETPLRKAMQVTQEKRSPAFAGNSTGLGWFIKDVSGRTVWWHNGGTTGFKTCNAFCEKPAVAVVVMCNTGSDADDDGRDFYRLGDALIRLLIEDEKKLEK